jgi:glycosyltransferase involved in cell wall biosynthesis
MCRALMAQGLDVLLATTDHGMNVSSSEFPVPGSNPTEVTTPQSSPTRNSKLETRNSYKGVPTVIFPQQAGESFKYSRPFAAWLNANVSTFDLVHIHAVFNHACIAAARACRKNGVPYIVRPLGTLDPWSMEQKSLRKKVFWHSGIKRMLTKAAAIHYTATAEKEAVETSLHLNHGFVVSLGVEPQPMPDPGAPQRLAEYFPSLQGRPYILVLSRLHPKKALELLINSFLSLVRRPEFSQWRLVIAGDGSSEYVSRLKLLVKEKDGEEFVVFTGWLQHEMKAVALSNAELLALTSHQENFGLCVAEAMSAGVAVLVSPQVNLAPEIESSGSGWVTSLDAELQETLEEAMRNKAERTVRGRAGRDYAVRHFAWTTIASELASRYNQIIEHSTTSHLIA